MDLRMVSGFQGAYRLQYHDYLSKAYVVCFVDLLTHTINFTLRSESVTDYTLYTLHYTLYTTLVERLAYIVS